MSIIRRLGSLSFHLFGSNPRPGIMATLPYACGERPRRLSQPGAYVVAHRRPFSTDESNPKEETWPRLLAVLTEELSEQTVDVYRVKKHLKNYSKEFPMEWRRFAKCDKSKLTRNLLYTCPRNLFEVLLLCWPPQFLESPIHNHKGSHCFFKVLSGVVSEIKYVTPPDDKLSSSHELREMGRKMASVGDVLHINNKIGIHQILNPDKENYAVTLHIYSPPVVEATIFDPETGAGKAVKLQVDRRLKDDTK